MSKFSNWSRENLEKFAQEATDKLTAEAQPVLVVEKEPDYWIGGHHHEGTRPHIDWFKIQKLPIGTKLYTAPPAAQPAEAQMTAPTAAAVPDYPQKIRDLLNVQRDEVGDEYMRGIYNGLELALCTFENRDPVYAPAAQIRTQDSRIPMTDEEIRALWAQCAPNPGGTLDFARLIERRCGSAWEAQLVAFIDAAKFRPLTEERGVLTMLTRHRVFDEDVPLYALARRNKTLDG